MKPVPTLTAEGHISYPMLPYALMSAGSKRTHDPTGESPGRYRRSALGEVQPLPSVEGCYGLDLDKEFGTRQASDDEQCAGG